MIDFGQVQLPSSMEIVLKALLYGAAAGLSALGGFHGYRMIGGNYDAKSEAIRDQLVFGDDADKLSGDESDAEPQIWDEARRKIVASLPESAARADAASDAIEPGDKFEPGAKEKPPGWRDIIS
jgi:hypothetical protein